MNNKRVLMVAGTASMIKQFNLRNIRILQSQGYTVHVAANFRNPGTITKSLSEELIQFLEEKGVVIHQIPFGRGMGTIKSNVKSVKELMKIYKMHTFDFVHVQSAIASVLVRICQPFVKQKIIYTIHGLQFDKFGTKLRWIMFYPIEWVLSFFTDTIVTINDHDSHIVKKTFRNKHTYQIGGVGIEFKRFNQIPNLPINESLVKKLGIESENLIMLSVGELSNRKNQKAVLRALSDRPQNDVHLILVGIGSEKESMEKYCNENGLSKNIHFLGYCDGSELEQIINVADISIFPSKLEGLLTAGLEMMAAGKVLLFSEVRGIKDYCIDSVNAISLNSTTSQDINEAIDKAKKFKQNGVLTMMGEKAQKTAIQYDKTVIDSAMNEIYKKMGSNQNG
ncbi:glycosyltransferase [Weissella cibaria]|uniref:glycosyltransferase n=1 Tax=Weissella cibaria TaxID=137591 RepID=UPI001E63903F|nr:glycosyltransferase [Weissella cibaria]MCC6122199.1 glycosyltransferase [Weissella cibaria]